MGSLGQPPANGQYTGGWAYPDAWANFYEGNQGFQAPQNQNSPSGALAATEYANNTNNPNDPNLLGWEQAYGNPNTILSQDQNWAQSLGSAPTNTPSGQLTGGWTNPEAWSAYYGGTNGFTAPNNAGSPASALAAASQIAATSNPQNNPALLGWVDDYGQPGSILANTPNWAASLGTPNVSAQGQDVGQTNTQGWESPLAWAAYYGGFQGFSGPQDNTLQAQENWAGVTNLNDPSLLGWELDYGNPQTVTSIIEGAANAGQNLQLDEQTAGSQLAAQQAAQQQAAAAQAAAEAQAQALYQQQLAAYNAQLAAHNQQIAQQQADLSQINTYNAVLSGLSAQLAGTTNPTQRASIQAEILSYQAIIASLQQQAGVPISPLGAPPSDNPYVGAFSSAGAGQNANTVILTYGPTAPLEYATTGGEVGGEEAHALGSYGETLSAQSPFTAYAPGTPLAQLSAFNQTDQLEGYIRAIETSGTGWHGGLNGLPAPNSPSQVFSGSPVVGAGYGAAPTGAGFGTNGPFNATEYPTEVNPVPYGSALGGFGGGISDAQQDSNQDFLDLQTELPGYAYNTIMTQAQQGLVPGLEATPYTPPIIENPSGISGTDYNQNVDDLGRPIPDVSTPPDPWATAYGNQPDNSQAETLGNLGGLTPLQQLEAAGVGLAGWLSPEVLAMPAIAAFLTQFFLNPSTQTEQPINIDLPPPEEAQPPTVTYNPDGTMNLPEIHVTAEPETQLPPLPEEQQQQPEEQQQPNVAPTFGLTGNIVPSQIQGFPNSAPQIPFDLNLQPIPYPSVLPQPQPTITPHEPYPTAPHALPQIPGQGHSGGGPPVQGTPGTPPNTPSVPNAPKVTLPPKTGGLPREALPGNVPLPPRNPNLPLPSTAAPVYPVPGVMPSDVYTVPTTEGFPPVELPAEPQPPAPRKSVREQTLAEGRDPSEIPDANQNLGEWLSNQHNFGALAGTMTGTNALQMGVKYGKLTQAEANKILAEAKKEYDDYQKYLKDKTEYNKKVGESTPVPSAPKNPTDWYKVAEKYGWAMPTQPNAPEAPQPLPPGMPRPPQDISEPGQLPPHGQPGNIRGRTNIAQIENEPASQAAIQRFIDAFPNVQDAKVQIYSLIWGESNFDNAALSPHGRYRGFFQMSTAEAGGDPQNMTFAEQMDAYTDWMRHNDPTGQRMTNLGLFNAASNPALQSQPLDTVVYHATGPLSQRGIGGGATEAQATRANAPTWGRYSGQAGGDITIRGIEQYYGRFDNQVRQQIETAPAGQSQEAPQAPNTDSIPLGTPGNRVTQNTVTDNPNIPDYGGGRPVHVDLSHGNPSNMLKQIQANGAAAFERAYPGYKVEIFSAYREQPGPHGSQSPGGAFDRWIVDPNGNIIPHRGQDTTGLYGKLFQYERGYVKQNLPNYYSAFNWGGKFETWKGSGMMDLEHIDLSGNLSHRQGIDYSAFPPLAPPETAPGAQSSIGGHGPMTMAPILALAQRIFGGNTVHAQEAPQDMLAFGEMPGGAQGSEEAEQNYLKNLYGPLSTLMKSNQEVMDRIMGMVAQEIGTTNTAENYRAVTQMIANQILGWANPRSGNQPPGLDPARIAAFLHNDYGRWWGTPQTLQQARAKLNEMNVNQRTVLKNAVTDAIEGRNNPTLTLPTGNYSYSPSSGFTQKPGVDVHVGDTVLHGLGGGAITNLVTVPGQTYPEALGSDQGNPAVTQWRTNRRNLMAGFMPGAYPSLPQGGF